MRLSIPKPTDVLGRIAAQTAKQVIMQKVREAERDTIYNEYNGRVGELVNCVVKRTEGPDVIVDLGRAEARMPKREQSRLETYNIGDRLRVVIRAVDRSAKGPQGDRLPRRSHFSAAPFRDGKSRKFTMEPCRFALPPVKPASAPKSLCRAATRTSIRWARA